MFLKESTTKIESVQNAAARWVTCSRKYDYVTPLLKDLHWLPIAERIMFKILLLTFKSLHNLKPYSPLVRTRLGLTRVKFVRGQFFFIPAVSQ